MSIGNSRGIRVELTFGTLHCQHLTLLRRMYHQTHSLQARTDELLVAVAELKMETYDLP
jgi:hypothetical protein